MTPPISIDGSNVQSATIDGEFVNYLTIDGQEVYIGEPAQPGVAYGTFSENVIVHDVDMNIQAKLSVASGDVNGGCEFSPDGKYLAYGDDDGKVYIHEINTNPGEYSGFDHIKTLSHWPDEVMSTTFSPNGRYLAFSGLGRRSARAGDPEDGQMAIYTTPLHPSRNGWDRLEVYYRNVNGHFRGNIGWSPDGNYMAHGGYHGDVSIYDATSDFAVRRRVHLHEYIDDSRTESDMAWSPDGNYFAYVMAKFGSSNAKLFVRENDAAGSQNFPVVHTDTNGGRRSMCGPAFSNDSSYLAYADRNGSLYIYDVPGFNIQKEISPVGFLRDWGGLFARMCEFTPDGNYLGVSTIQSGIKVFSVPGFNEVTTVGANKNDPNYEGMYTNSKWHPLNGPFNF